MCPSVCGRGTTEGGICLSRPRPWRRTASPPERLGRELGAELWGVGHPADRGARSFDPRSLPFPIRDLITTRSAPLITPGSRRRSHRTATSRTELGDDAAIARSHRRGTTGGAATSRTEAAARVACLGVDGPVQGQHRLHDPCVAPAELARPAASSDPSVAARRARRHGQVDEPASGRA